MRSLLRRRTVQLALFIPGLMAGWVASAGAGAGLPPLPPPPITVPTLTIPTVTVPTVTVPPVPQPPQAPPPPTVPGVTLPSVHPLPPKAAGGDGVSSGGGGLTAPSGSPGTGGSSQRSGEASTQRGRASRARVHRLRLTRDWISTGGPKKQRRTTLVFVLRRPALVEFVVLRVSPDCRRIGRFRVRGHRGVNRIRLGGSIGRRSLVPGTYRFVARTLPGGRTVVETRLVVVRNSSRREVREARHANACPTASDSGSGAISTATDTAVGGSAAPSGDKGIKPARDRHALGERFVRYAFSPVEEIPIWLIVLSALALGLLLTAAQLPKSAPPREVIASLALGMTVAAVFFLVAIALL